MDLPKHQFDTARGGLMSVSTLRIVQTFLLLVAIVNLPFATAQNTTSTFGASSNLASRNELVMVNVVQEGVNTVLRIKTQQALSLAPPDFWLEDPDRLVIDLPGVTSPKGRSLQSLDGGALLALTVVPTPNRTRLLIRTKERMPYSIVMKDDLIRFVFPPLALPSPLPLPSTLSILGIDSSKAPLVPVSIAAAPPLVPLATPAVVSPPPARVANKPSTTDFEPTPVVLIPPISTTSSVTPALATVANSVNAEPRYTGEKISLNFQNIEVRAVLQIIADFTNFNVVTSDGVTGAVTLRLKDIPWDQALDIVMQARGLGMRKNGTVLWIAPREEIAAKEKQELESRAALEGLESLQTQSFQLNYAKAIDIAAQLSTGRASGAVGAIGVNTGFAFNTNTQASGRILSVRGSAVADARTNQLMVNDVPAKLEQVRQVIKRLDIPIRQVLIEARIVEADDKFSRALGVKLGGASGTINIAGNANVGFGGSYGAVTNASGQTTGTLDATSSQFVSLPAVGLNGYNASTFAVSLFNSSASRFLNLEISALEAEGKGKIVSSPRVVTADQVKAIIEQGTELPYQVATASGATSIAFRKANLKLEVVPQITPDGNIILDVDVNKDSVGQSTTAGFAIDTKHVKTQVLIENGGTVVIGGIFEMLEREDITKVPGLGDLPWIGALFRSKQKIVNKSELLVFLTPRTITTTPPNTESSKAPR
jgi:type IV pilus assembly protein PilQ